MTKIHHLKQKDRKKKRKGRNGIRSKTHALLRVRLGSVERKPRRCVCLPCANGSRRPNTTFEHTKAPQQGADKTAEPGRARQSRPAVMRRMPLYFAADYLEHTDESTLEAENVKKKKI